MTWYYWTGAVVVSLHVWIVCTSFSILWTKRVLGDDWTFTWRLDGDKALTTKAELLSFLAITTGPAYLACFASVLWGRHIGKLVFEPKTKLPRAKVYIKK